MSLVPTAEKSNILRCTGTEMQRGQNLFMCEHRETDFVRDLLFMIQEPTPRLSNGEKQQTTMMTMPNTRSTQERGSMKQLKQLQSVTKKIQSLQAVQRQWPERSPRLPKVPDPDSE